MRQKTGFPSGRTDEEFGTNRRHIQNEVIRERSRNVAGEILSNAKDPVNIGGGGWTRTNDLRIMSPIGGAENTETKDLASAKSGKVMQNPHQPRTKRSKRRQTGERRHEA